MTAVFRIKITNRQSIIVSTVGSVMVRVTGLEPAYHKALEPKGNVTILEIYIRYYRQHSIMYKKLLNIL